MRGSDQPRISEKSATTGGIVPERDRPESFRHVAVDSLAQRPLIRGNSASNPTHKDSLFKSILVAEFSKRIRYESLYKDSLRSNQ